MLMNMLLILNISLFHIASVYLSDHTAADLILYNGKVYTMEIQTPVLEALAIKDQRIIHTGNNQTVKEYRSESTVSLDLRGKCVLPGLIESHAHYMSLGYKELKLKLANTSSWNDVVDLVADAVSKTQSGTWIRGRGWHQEKWSEIPEDLVDGYPVHHLLSAVSPNHPVYLEHASGHGIIVNAAAMDRAGITQTTPDPPGGRILHDQNGAPSGVFLENAEDLIYLAMYSELQKRNATVIQDEKEKAFEMAAKNCIENGITTFHDAGVEFEDIDFYKKMIDENRSPVRLWVMIRDTITLMRKKLADYKILNYGDAHLTVRSVKQYMDGALGSRGAWLLEPYSDLPDQSGLPSTPFNIFEEACSLAAASGFQMCTHAIGDRGNRMTLDIYEKILRKYADGDQRRWRIEHAQHLHPDDIPRFAKSGIIAAMQTNHCTSDGPWVPKRIGKKRSEQGAYVWQSLIRSGAIICNGTDAPVEDINPFFNIYSAVSRRMNNGDQFYPQQCMTREQVLRAYSVYGAYAGFDENLKGRLAPGMLADLIVLSQDIMTVAEEEIPKTEVLYTIIGGKIVYQKI